MTYFIHAIVQDLTIIIHASEITIITVDTLVITIHGITIMSFIGMEITTIKTRTETIMSTRMVGGNSITKMALIN